MGTRSPLMPHALWSIQKNCMLYVYVWEYRLTSLVFQRCRWVGKWSARGKLSKLSGSFIGSPSENWMKTHTAKTLEKRQREKEGKQKNMIKLVSKCSLMQVSMFFFLYFYFFFFFSFALQGFSLCQSLDLLLFPMFSSKVQNSLFSLHSFRFLRLSCSSIFNLVDYIFFFFG